MSTGDLANPLVTVDAGALSVVSEYAGWCRLVDVHVHVMPGVGKDFVNAVD
jgi:hypothetical protein